MHCGCSNVFVCLLKCSIALTLREGEAACVFPLSLILKPCFSHTKQFSSIPLIKPNEDGYTYGVLVLCRKVFVYEAIILPTGSKDGHLIIYVALFIGYILLI